MKFLVLIASVLIPLSAVAETIYPGQTSTNGVVTCQAFPVTYTCSCHDNWSDTNTATVNVQGPAGDITAVRASAQTSCAQTNLAHGFTVSSCINVLF
jgi:hypothetical protein